MTLSTLNCYSPVVIEVGDTVSFGEKLDRSGKVLEVQHGPFKRLRIKTKFETVENVPIDSVMVISKGVEYSPKKFSQREGVRND